MLSTFADSGNSSSEKKCKWRNKPRRRYERYKRLSINPQTVESRAAAGIVDLTDVLFVEYSWFLSSQAKKIALYTELCTGSFITDAQAVCKNSHPIREGVECSLPFTVHGSCVIISIRIVVPAGTLTACKSSNQSMMVVVKFVAVVMEGMKIMMTMMMNGDGTVTMMMATKR